MAGKGNTRPTKYFKHNHIAWYGAIGVGITLLFISWFAPNSSIAYLLKPLGYLTRIIGVEWSTAAGFLILLTVVIHVAESAYAVVLSRRNNLDLQSTLKWAFFTFLFGFGSLSVLKRYDAKQSKSNKSSNEGSKIQQKPKARKR